MSSEDHGCGISGYVKPEYKPVIDYWKTLNKIDQDKRGQVCCYIGDELVIDCIMDNEKTKDGFNADSITNVWSSGKTVGAILVAIMVDKGLLKYDAPISEYWPEFA